MPISRPAQNSFGSAWSCVEDLTMPSVMVTGFRVVAEAIVRRWTTPRGGLVDDPEYGYDLTDYIGDDLNPSDVAQVASFAAAEARKDERVQFAKVSITMSLAGAMSVTASILTASGPFLLVLSIDQVSVSILQVTAQ